MPKLRPILACAFFVLLLGLAMLLFRQAFYGILLSGVLAFVLFPLHKRWIRRMKDGLAACCCVALLCLPLVALVACSPLLLRQFQVALGSLDPMGQAVQAQAERVFSALGERGLPPETLDALREQLARFLADLSAEGITQWLMDGAARLPELYWLLLVPFLTFYCLRDHAAIAAAFLRVFSINTRRHLRRIGHDMAAAVYGFYRAQVAVALFVGVSTGLLLTAVGIPYAMAWGVLHFLLNFIPYFGAWMGLVPILALTLPDQPGRAILGVLAVLAVQQIENLFVTPHLVGQRVGLHPAWVLLLLVCSGAFLGVWGMMLILPLALTLRLLVSSLYESLVESRSASMQTVEKAV